MTAGNSKGETLVRSGHQTKSTKSGKKYVKKGCGYEEESLQQGQTAANDLTLMLSEEPTPPAIEQTKLINLACVIYSP